MISKAEELLNEWIAAEKAIDIERLQVISMLQRKAKEIHDQRMDARYKIIKAQQLFQQYKSKQDDARRMSESSNGDAVDRTGLEEPVGGEV